MNLAAENQTVKPSFRWSIRRDLPRVLEIEKESFPADLQWTEEDFLAVLRRRTAIGLIAEIGETIVGYALYEFGGGSVDLISLAVAEEYRRRGIGRAMVEHICLPRFSGRVERIDLMVRETNVTAQLFFRSCGFTAISISRGHYNDTGEDGYGMEFWVTEQAAA